MRPQRVSPTGRSRAGGPRSATSSTGAGARAASGAPRSSRTGPAWPLSRVPPSGGGRCEAEGVATIRALRDDDWDDWRALWGGYLAFYRAELPEETSGATFDRLCAGEDGMFGLLALDDLRNGI